MISVPYLEGTRAFWEPLVLGHEVGHVKMFYENHWESPATQGSPYSDLLLTELAFPTTDLLRNWLQEFICDLNAYRLYGPAMIPAMAEMFMVVPPHANVSSTVPKAMNPLESHPPRSARIELICRLAETLGDSTSDLYPFIEDGWSQLRNEPPLNLSQERKTYLTGFIDALPVLWRYICKWGDRYDFISREASVEWLAIRLQNGVPGGLASERAGQPNESLAGDIINAAWAAEKRKQDLGIPIDNLALKALDNLSVAQLWFSSIDRLLLTEGSLSLRETPTEWVAAAKSRPAAPSGPLSGVDLLALLAAESESGFVATPLLPGAIREAGIDVRLSGAFITFKHSATEVFDAVAGGQDPREMSEWVEKGWGERFILHPDELVLAATTEYFVLPNDIRGQVASRSSQGRLGLVSVTASMVQPGTMGCITLELVNQGQTPIALTVGERVAQIDFERMINPVPQVLQPTYRCATGPEFSQIRLDWDHPIIREGQKEQLGIAPEISISRAKELYDNGIPMVDVRTEEEWADGHAPRAINIPEADFALAIAQLPTKGPVIVTSRTGYRAERGAAELRRLGINAVVMKGGMRLWRAKRLPLDTGE